jgi:predicted transcriptional regulator
MIDKEISKVFFFKGTELLIAIRTSRLNERYAMKLSKIIQVGYARVNQLLTLFDKLKLTEFIDMNGRTKGVKLTKKGEEIADTLISIRRQLV